MQDKKILPIPMWDIPYYRQKVAENNGCFDNVAIVPYGGLGDILCAEPTVRYLCEVLGPKLGVKKITVITGRPEIFRHLPVDFILAKDGKVAIENGTKSYHFLYCGFDEGNAQHLFFTHNSMHCVDYPALSALRMGLPTEYKALKTGLGDLPKDLEKKNYIVVHPGNHWKSKTFPKKWWDSIIQGLAPKTQVVLLGGRPGGDPGTVVVDPSGCLDLRGNLSILDSARVLAEAAVVLSNDSFPMHLAAQGKAFIGFFSTAKDPEYIYHWRRNTLGEVEWKWRMENLALGGAYQRSLSPRAGGNHLSDAEYHELMAWLPSPGKVIGWTLDKLDSRD